MQLPKDALIGKVGQGFPIIMNNFNSERLMMSAQAATYARLCAEAAVSYARQRRTFGTSLASPQVIRHKVAEMWRHVLATESLLYTTTWKLMSTRDNPKAVVADLCLLKVQSSLAMEACAREAMQVARLCWYLLCFYSCTQLWLVCCRSLGVWASCGATLWSVCIERCV
jgi:acyl-CoA dehydrogenase